jgi:hypothetical protein
MKNLLLILLSVLTMQGYGQTANRDLKIGENRYAALNDSLPQVIYKNNSVSKHQTAWLVDNQLAGEYVTKTINPEQIGSVDVSKRRVVIDSISYDSQVTIAMKEGYHPKFISLNNLKAKYTNLKDSPVLFMMENEIVQGDYDKYLVDECYLLQIIVDKIELKREKMDFFLVRVLTRTPENIKKAKEIRIR